MPGRMTANVQPSSASVAYPTTLPPQQQGKPWPGLGKVVDVLQLQDIDQAVRDLSL